MKAFLLLTLFYQVKWEHYLIIVENIYIKHFILLGQLKLEVTYILFSYSIQWVKILRILYVLFLHFAATLIYFFVWFAINTQYEFLLRGKSLKILYVKVKFHLMHIVNIGLSLGNVIIYYLLVCSVFFHLHLWFDWFFFLAFLLEFWGFFFIDYWLKINYWMPQLLCR
jgi:hypothetical protein